MAAKSDTDRLLEEYSSLQRMIATHHAIHRSQPIHLPAKRPRILTEDAKKQVLMQEYSKLKRMIDRHKQGHMSRQYSTIKNQAPTIVPPHKFPCVKNCKLVAVPSDKVHKFLNKSQTSSNITRNVAPTRVLTPRTRFVIRRQPPKPSPNVKLSPAPIPSTSKMQCISTRKASTPLKSRYKIVHGAKLSATPTSRIKFRNGKYSLKYVSQRSASKLKTQVHNWRSKSKSKSLPRLTRIGGIQYKSSRNKLLKSDMGTVKSAKNSMRSTKGVGKPSRVAPRQRQIITIKGIKFSMAVGGKSLRRLETRDAADVASCAKPRVDRVSIGGITYCETRPGMLTPSPYHLRVRSMANRALNRSINHLATAKRKSKQFCLFFNKFGTCVKQQKGTCPYIHDKSKVAVCKRFLHGGCNQENCQFSHEICVSKMPVCNFFLHGRCRSDTCPYLHVNVNPDAGVCEEFQKGYCPNGETCKKWHIAGERRETKVKRKRKRSVATPKEPDLPTNVASDNATCLPTFIPLNNCDCDDLAAPKIENRVRIQPEFLLNSFSTKK